MDIYALLTAGLLNLITIGWVVSKYEDLRQNRTRENAYWSVLGLTTAAAWIFVYGLSTNAFVLYESAFIVLVAGAFVGALYAYAWKSSQGKFDNGVIDFVPAAHTARSKIVRLEDYQKRARGQTGRSL